MIAMDLKAIWEVSAKRLPRNESVLVMAPCWIIGWTVSEVGLHGGSFFNARVKPMTKFVPIFFVSAIFGLDCG